MTATTATGDDPVVAFRSGLNKMFVDHEPQYRLQPSSNVVVGCKCGKTLDGGWYEWTEHLVDHIVMSFPPAVLEVTDRQARIDELIGEMEEWAAGRKSMWNSFAAASADDAIKQAGCAITDAVEILKRFVLLQTLVAAVKIGV